MPKIKSMPPRGLSETAADAACVVAHGDDVDGGGGHDDDDERGRHGGKREGGQLRAGDTDKSARYKFLSKWSARADAAGATVLPGSRTARHLSDACFLLQREL